MNEWARWARFSVPDWLSPISVILWIQHVHTRLLLSIFICISWCLEILKEPYPALELFIAVPCISQLINRGMTGIGCQWPSVTQSPISFLELTHPVELPLQDCYDFFVKFGVETKEHGVFIPGWTRLLIFEVNVFHLCSIFDAAVELKEELVEPHAVNADWYILEQLVAVCLLEHLRVLCMNKLW